MAQWSRNKVDSSSINNGNEYTRDDVVSLQQLNALVNSGLYSQDFVEAITDNVDVTEANNVGIPNVSFVDYVKNGKTYKKLKFSNLKGNSGVDGTDGTNGKDGTEGYDLIIRTQDEFDLFVEDLQNETLTAFSVLVVGDGGNLKYTVTGNTLPLPSTLKLLEGRNNAIINMICGDNQTLIYYTSEDNDDCYISNIDVDVTVNRDSGILFSKCKNIYDCHVIVRSFEVSNSINPFSECKNLNNCSIERTNTFGVAQSGSAPFIDCENLVNCHSTLSGASCFIRCKNLINCEGTTSEPSAYVFNLCKYLVNCKGSARQAVFTNCDYLINCYAEAKCTTSLTGLFADNAIGFWFCEYLTNCYGKGTAIGLGAGSGFAVCNYLSNCTGVGIKGDEAGTGYAFNSISYASNCSGSTSEPSSDGVLGGSNTFIDSETVG